MNAYYQLKSKQTCTRVFLDIKLFISTLCKRPFWINLAMIEFRLMDCGKSQSIATD